MRSVALILISVIPIYVIRKYMYLLLFGYVIDSNSYIGMFNLIDCKELIMTKARIGFMNQIQIDSLKMYESSLIYKFNRIKNINKLYLSDHSKIHSKNFIGGPAKNVPLVGREFKNQNLFLGIRSSILRSNYFDVVCDITIGDNVVFGGNGSEIWTHGFLVDRTFLFGPVTFGNNIFIGSNCIFTKDVSVCDNVSIGPASVIYKSINSEGLYSSHKQVKLR